MSIEHYLKERYRQSTTIGYMREINSFLAFYPDSATASYKDIVTYIGTMRAQKAGAGKLSMAVMGIKQYYHYLLHSGKRKDHPCRFLRLRDHRKKPIQLQDLFSEKELERLLERPERYKLAVQKNKIIISLLIYQGLTTGEIVTLEVKNINLDEGMLYIKGTGITNSRTIGLKTNQVMLLHRYLTEARPKLIEKHRRLNKQPWTKDELILTWQGTPENGEGVHYLIETFKHLFPGRNLNPKTIRQSVIRNLLSQGKDVRVVQEYVGHKSPDTTERYRQADVETLQAQINKYHPIQ